MPELFVKVGNRRFRGWQSLSVTRGIEQLASTFSLAVAGTGRLPLANDELRVAIDIDDHRVVTGFVDDDVDDVDAKAHTGSYTGRSKLGDLVDCSAIGPGNDWKGRTLDQIATDLIKPFGIGLVVAADIGAPFEYNHSQPGETIYEQLARGARLRGLLLTDDAQGRLVITREGTRQAGRLVLGDNLKRLRVVRTRRDRFATYICRGQQRATGNSWVDAEASRGEARDTGVTRPRTLLIDAIDPSDTAGCVQLAQWEAQRRKGRSTLLEATVQGWLNPDDANRPWQPNTLVAVQAPNVPSSPAKWLVQQVEFVLDNDGQRTQLQLVPRGTFAAPALPEAAP